MTAHQDITLSTPNSEFLGSRRNQHLLALALLVLFVAIAYGDTLRYDFVYDDHKQIVDKAEYFTDVSWLPEYFKHPMTLNYYRPLFLAWFLLNRLLFGFSPMGWHATTVLAHAAATLLAYSCAYLLTRRTSFAFIVGAIFAVSPSHVESVAWISGVSDPLLAIFVFGAFACYLAGRESSRRVWWWSCSALLALGGMFSKEVGIASPILIALHALVFAEGDWRSRLRVSALAIAPSAVLAVGYLAIRHYVMQGLGHSLSDVGNMVRTWPKAWMFYLGHLLWPVRLSIFYDFYLEKSFSIRHVLLPALLFAVIAGMFLYLCWKYRSRLAFFSALWIVVTLAPAMYFRAFNPYDLVHDRYLYLPVFGFALILVNLLEHIPSGGLQLLRTKASTVALSAAIVTFFLLTTLAEEAYYAGDLKLYYRAVQLSPNNVFGWMNLGVELAQIKRFDEAEFAYRRAIALTTAGNDRNWLIHDNLGYLLVEIGRFDAAEKELNISLGGNPRNAKTYMHYSVLRMRQERWADARDEMQKAINIDPQNPEYHYLQALVYNRLGDREHEKMELQIVLKLNPSHKHAGASLEAGFGPQSPQK